ncbi:MAG TPA: alpha/beta hydrolase [Anditalea sp.]|nr:alpha/beta hydrolase [Anditalea sp.]
MKTLIPLKKLPLIFLLVFFTFSTFGWAQTPIKLKHFSQQTPSPENIVPYGNNPDAGNYVNAGDAKIYYEVYGQGQPLVVLHGGIFGSTFEMFQLIDSLKQNYHVIAVSTRGHGKSELGYEPITYEQKAKDVISVINAVTKDSVIVLGFSDGGFTGYKLASMYPERVKKLIAIGASELYPGIRNFSYDAGQAYELESVYWDQQLSLMPEPHRLQEMFSGLANMYNNLTIGKEFLDTIKSPVFVMAGDRDQSNPVLRVVNTAHMIQNSQLSIIPNTTHATFLENFPAVWASILPFLNR